MYVSHRSLSNVELKDMFSFFNFIRSIVKVNIQYEIHF